VPEKFLVNSILAIWAIATLPQTVVSITFSVVMNAVAGPDRRFDLMSRRWSTMGVTTSLSVLAIGQLLDGVIFPLNYRLMFIGMSVGALISYYYSSHIVLEPTIPPPLEVSKSIKSRFAEFKNLIWSEKPFVSFMTKRFIFMAGVNMSAPLIPLYLVRVAHASDGWISVINMCQTAILIVAYFYWTRHSRKYGSRSVLVWTTLGLSLYPALVATTVVPWQIAIFAGIGGIFSAGIDLIFFDELMKTVPVQYSAIFVSIAQMIQFSAAIISPILGTFISDTFSLQVGLVLATAIRFSGFLAFWLGGRKKPNKKVPAA
jgi:Na+/melibiose symporter-like transporter